MIIFYLIYATGLLTEYIFGVDSISPDTNDNILQRQNIEKEVEQYQDTHLPRLLPVKVHHEQDVELTPGDFRKLRTLSVNPPIFEIKHFLTPYECNYLISKATKFGLTSSRTTLDSKNNLDLEVLNLERFHTWDLNNDKNIDMNEASISLDENQDVFLNGSRWGYIFQQLGIDQNNDGLISKKEFKLKNSSALVYYIRKVKEENPETKNRNSMHVGIENDENDIVIQKIQDKIISTTRLPVQLVKNSEGLQIVKYEEQGHYNCHTDSEMKEDHRPCCHIYANNVVENESEISGKFPCIACRYMTFLYFLNEVESGGETAFPLADNESFSKQNWDLLKPELCNLAKNCEKSNYIVKPEKGKAIIWYNHKVNETSKWLGELDLMSFHGGCDVISDVKWIANNWINVAYNKTEDILNWIITDRDLHDEF